MQTASRPGSGSLRPLLEAASGLVHARRKLLHPKMHLGARDDVTSFRVGVQKSDFGGAERFPKHLVIFIPAGGILARSYLGTPQLCCYLLHFRPSPVRPGPNPCALPIESASGPFGGFGEGQENLGGNRADGLPAWFRLPSASPGGGFGSCSHRDVASGLFPASLGCP